MLALTRLFSPSPEPADPAGAAPGTGQTWPQPSVGSGGLVLVAGLGLIGLWLAIADPSKGIAIQNDVLVVALSPRPAPPETGTTEVDKTAQPDNRADNRADLRLQEPSAQAKPDIPPLRTDADQPKTEIPAAALALPDPQPVTAPRMNGEEPVFLDPVPDLGLIAESPQGFLPRIGDEGRLPRKVYARPVSSGHHGEHAGKPRIGLLIQGIGVGAQASAQALAGLPGVVSVSVASYAESPQSWTNRARGHGHEVFLDLPMEPYGYPRQDPGPKALLTRLDPSERRGRLHHVLTRTTGYVGLVNVMGGAFMAQEEEFKPVLEDLSARGLAFLDNGEAAGSRTMALAPQVGLAAARAHLQIDAKPSPRRIDLALLELEALARSSGSAIGIGTPLPVTVARIAAWAPTLERKGLVLAPVSAMMAENPGTAGPDGPGPRTTRPQSGGPEVRDAHHFPHGADHAALTPAAQQ